MDDVTAGFDTYDLSKICDEYKINVDETEKQEVLPKLVGGSRVHLLLGIKNTNLDPVLIKRLPSGIAVYWSPFKYVCGSRIILLDLINPSLILSQCLMQFFFMRRRLEEFELSFEERNFNN